MSFNDKPDLAELAHFGIKGMKWGHHKSQPTGGGGGGGSAAKPPSNRQLNKQFKAKENVKRDAEIDKARERYNTKGRENYLNAKAQYKADKKTIGTAAARDKFNKVKQQNIDDFEIASQAKSGREATMETLSIVGTVAVAVILGAVAHR